MATLACRESNNRRNRVDDLVAKDSSSAEANARTGPRVLESRWEDNAIWRSVYGSQGKAIASVGFGWASGELAARAGSPIIQDIMAAEGAARRGLRLRGRGTAVSAGSGSQRGLPAAGPVSPLRFAPSSRDDLRGHPLWRTPRNSVASS